ncbi:MAG TPA: hypothetical protein VN861_08725 [Candidatus Acidoferrales bacterium]|nr:hypothetical protein [Candidatus Acidoferrales bacterium]
MRAKADAVYFVVVLCHLGLEREIAALKVRRHYPIAFTPYSLDGSIGIENHVSYKSSGERHVVSRYRVGDKMKEVKRIRKESTVHFARPSNLKGAVEIYLSGDPLGQFRDLRPAGSGKGERVLLDAEKAGFRDGIFVVKIYAVEPSNEGCVPTAPDAGKRVLHFIKSTDPWIAIDVYQPKPVLNIP